MDYILIGSGGLASEVMDCLLAKQETGVESVRIIGMVNDSQELFDEQNSKYGFEAVYLGSINSHQYDRRYGYIIAFSDIKRRKQLLLDLLLADYHLPTVVHPSVSIPKCSFLGTGCVIGPYAVIGRNVSIGVGNVITAYSFLSHDCRVGSFNFLSTVGLAGQAQIGDENFFGIRSTVLPNIVVGNRNTVQAGMMVDSHVGDDTTVFYRFKEKLHVQLAKVRGDL